MSAPHPEPVHPGDFVDCGNGLWNARGSFKIAGVLEGGTHASLVAMDGGRFLWLDSITITEKEIQDYLRAQQADAEKNRGGGRA